MLPFTHHQYHTTIRNAPGILVGDIGGTNSNFGIAQMINYELTLVHSIHIKSKQIVNFNQTVADILTYVQQAYKITITDACLAVAGVVTPAGNHCAPTNLHITIDVNDIICATKLCSVSIVNDFEVIGYGIEKIDPKDIITIQKGTPHKYGNKAILGAGTGLGKATMHWLNDKKRYISIASEGGHADFAAQTQQELDLITYIKTHEKISYNISWEQILNGTGIGRIFNFFASSTHQNTSNKNTAAPLPDEIFKDKNFSPTHQKTAELYAKIYARCAKSWTLDTLALSGIYIAGGIAAHNVDLFKLPCFLQEFLACDKQRNLLTSIPIFIIADYNISLYGAIEYMRLQGRYGT